jgi:hypothetical protein
MQSGHALSTTRKIGATLAPAAAAVITMGAMVAPAVAQGHHRGHRHHAAASSTHEARTITIRGIVTGTPSATQLQIIRVRHGHSSCLGTPKVTTLLLDQNTTFATQGVPVAAWSDLAPGDAVTVTVTIPADGGLATTPVTSVADTGTPAPVTCVVRGLATTDGSVSSVTIAVGSGHGRRSHHHGHGHRTNAGRHNANLHRLFTNAPGSPTSLTVQFDVNTVFVDTVTPGATIDQIARGDRLTIIWSVPPGTPLDSAPAAEVIDRGPPPPIRYVARGTAASVGTLSGVGLTVRRIHPNVTPRVARGSVLPVAFDPSTVFVDVGHPGATLDQIALGDRLIVIWRAPRGIAAVNLPAAVRVIDLGQPGLSG